MKRPWRQCSGSGEGTTHGSRGVGVVGLVAAGAVLAACTGGGSAGPTAPSTTSGVATSASVTERLDEAMRGIVSFSGSVLVARGDEVLLTKGYGLADAARGTANGPDTRFQISGLTEQFTGAAILLLQQQGRLTVKDPVCRYLPRCPAAWRSITIHELLTHTSGLPNFTDLPEFEKVQDRPTTPAEELGWVRDLPLKFTPGSNFRFSDTGYLALGLVIEKVSGASYENFVQRAILKPLRMADSGYDTGDDRVAVGYTRGSTVATLLDPQVGGAAWGLYSTAPDMLRWELGLVNGKLLDAKGTATMTTPAVEDTDQHDLGFAYGTYASLGSGKRVLLSGGGTHGFRSLLRHDTATGVAVVVLTNEEAGADLYEVALLLAQTLR